MTKYIDVHTHKSNKDSTVFAIKNTLLHKQIIQNNGYFSAGWHPWYLKDYSLPSITQSLETVQQYSHVIAIGECGLDRAITNNMDHQIDVFNQHIIKAKELEKPLIIHCVKAYSDMLQILKACQPTVPLIFHDFRGNQHIIDQLERFNSFFSFGQSLFSDNPKLIKTFQAIPTSKLFLETDESVHSIQKIYLRASILKGISEEELIAIIKNNFSEVFGDGLVK